MYHLFILADYLVILSHFLVKSDYLDRYLHVTGQTIKYQILKKSLIKELKKKSAKKFHLIYYKNLL